MQRIEAQVLIPGRGDPVADGVVVMDGPRIVYAGRARDAPPIDDAVVTEAHLRHAGHVGLPRPLHRDIGDEPRVVGVRAAGGGRCAIGDRRTRCAPRGHHEHP